MPRITAAAAGGQNVLACLDMIAWAEGTSISPATLCDGYDVIVIGSDGLPEIFENFTDHPFAAGRPSKRVDKAGKLTSNASGRYQQMLKDWPHYKALLQLPDFGPLSQDLLAIRHIRESRALDDVKAGRIVDALKKFSNIWASLPFAKYPGQRTRSLDDCVRIYRLAGGVVSK
ncbi:glycoside hydrolase family 24 protein [Pseudomonas denitrificans (nom. rej.)]|uniref:Glycoside hydrolase family 104 protein n=1 Tax=Pseudomonas denitrificans TaxID=43306 RepID=A0A9X7N730_PSEDE|nr:glycoside hydrolase family 104 protein [Pseudomonas denitrificans (nom. rej.)]QEY75806.1 glycoside hydrolase family 104 protein [Pseudomonas denitrificans (nom. rej.)]